MLLQNCLEDYEQQQFWLECGAGLPTLGVEPQRPLSLFSKVVIFCKGTNFNSLEISCNWSYQLQVGEYLENLGVRVWGGEVR